jgi:hypothetical protein
LSAFEYHCAGCYDLPFTGRTLILLVQIHYTYITEYYPVWKKFGNSNFERVSLGLYYVVEGFFNPKVVNLKKFTVSLLSNIL